MMSGTENEIDVLVVGAGPVGLALAYALRRHGLTCRVLDQRQSPADTSRALGVFNKTLEIFELLGMAEQVAARAQPVHFMNAYARGKHLMQVSFELKDFETPFTYPVFCPQTHVEGILRQCLAEKDTPIEWGWALEMLEQDEEGVNALLRNEEGQEQQVRARWLAGCDGGHSKVRHLLELPFEGSPDETWLVADVNLDWSLARDSVYSFLAPEGTVMAFPFPDGKRWRLLNTTVSEQTDPASIAEQFTTAINNVYYDEPVVVPEPLWYSIFTIQQRHVHEMRAGHCFVVGDAAHVHSPASGQGMNTGIQDAFNLAWKLALVSRGLAEDRLLNSYSAEREPIAVTVLRGARAFTRVLGNQQSAVQQVRNTVLKGFFVLPPLRKVLNQQVSRYLSELALNYKHSPIVAEDWQVTSINARNMPGLQAGSRVPDIHYGINSKARLYDMLRDTHHTALLFTGLKPGDDELVEVASLTEHIKQLHHGWLQLFLITPDSETYEQLKSYSSHEEVILDQYGTLHRRFGAEGQALYVIRPDHHVGYRNQPALADDLDHYAGRIMGIHETVPAS
ncbi:FAD-dependent oxidoreductase [Dictyobacter kobayashii]|uniref:Oxygenase n=1 Tax=Dictyobacter kobayashii TaxID=2014872 RepID=A0A402AYH5_9CHLR|nr:FAD-dependent oxidoreductase [Dictyobacter kobayashii]GCE24156.1 oxygenase [Dictyobacter kobayashii]